MKKLAIIGLGYVGLPLAVEFGKTREVIGFDVSQQRIRELQDGKDRTNEVSFAELQQASGLTFSNSLNDLSAASIYIVTVPTPVDNHKKPDFSPLLSACTTLGNVLKHGDIVIFESTVYPGATEEVCVPRLEELSGLVFNQDFYVGYSPERINPGDKQHRLADILKVTSGSTPGVAEEIDALYASIITAGTYRASSIKVAEAAKVIENTQRDVNIALINELAIIFNKMGIDTEEVLKAAGTKWNFLPFRPGLVGGHCIGVDPYYLTYKAKAIGYNPEMILAGRRLNDNMAHYVVTQLIKKMINTDIKVNGSRVLVLGMAFKENCPDIRNSKVIDIIRELKDFDVNVDVFDPWVSNADTEAEFGISLVEHPQPASYDAVVLAVGHDNCREIVGNIKQFVKSKSVIYDLKHMLPAAESDLRL